MSQDKIPPDIARKIAQMAKAPPPAPRAGLTPQKPVVGSPSAGGFMIKLAIAGWLLAAVGGAVAFGGYRWAAADKQAALDALTAQYEVRLQQLKAESDALVQRTQADALATQQVMQTELDFQRMPALPLKLVFRPGQVLYVESEAAEEFVCKVRLFRPSTSARTEVDFSINARTFKDLGAIENWVFARGDQLEFVKPGFKPWKGEVP